MATTAVNGVICFDPAYEVKKSDIIKYDGKKISVIEKKIVIMLHKPKNFITTVIDTHDRKTVMDLIPNDVHLNPVGRLDKNTTGLLLLTNDGDLHQYLTHPKNLIPKDYEAIIEGKLDQIQMKKIKKGIYIGHKEYGRANVLNQDTKKGRSKVLLQLTQGKKREIRRLFYRLGVKLLTLKRVKFSNLNLGNLSVGNYLKLNDKQIQLLKG